MRHSRVSSTSSKRSVEQRHGQQADGRATMDAIEPRLLLSAVAVSTVMPTLASGDFNGDGSPDSLVIVSAGRTRLADFGFAGPAFRRGSLLLLDANNLLLGDPLGIRARGNTTPAVAVGDFNSDGRLDLVVGGGRLAGAGGNGLSFLAGNGDGTFATGVPIAGAPTNVTSLVAGDVNGDGHLDLIGTSVGGATNNGSGGVTHAHRPVAGRDRNDRGTTTDVGPGDFGVSRSHLVGASAEAGGGVVDTESVALSPDPLSGGEFGTGRDTVSGVGFSLPPGFTPAAARVGASAEAGGAVVRLGFGDVLINGGSVGQTEQTFVLLGNGDGTFTAGSTITTTP